jgi:two-component system NarL family sensor kinase
VRSPVAQFALSGLLVVVVVAIVGVLAVRHISRDEALFDAKQLTELAGNAVVAPAIGPGVVTEDPAALARLDRVVRRDVLRDPVVRVKLWDESGRIVYSDEPRLIGQRYTLEPDERELFRRQGVHADLSDLTRPENRFERGEGPLREVYLGIQGPHGEHLLFETYLREGAIASETHRVWRDVIPIVVGVLLALWLVQIPLGRQLSRRLQRAQHQALTASEHERRRLARDLHDGVVQDLVAVSLTLGAKHDHESGAEVRKAIRRLRTLSVELYPEDLLELETELEIDDGLQLGRDTEALFYRTAHEALRNVAAHADARRVTVRVTAHSLEVADDGRGFTAPSDDRPHLGLRILDDLAREHGGALEIRSTPGQGTSILLKL